MLNKKVNKMTGNGCYVNPQKFALKKHRKITFGEIIFGGFEPFGTTVVYVEQNCLTFPWCLMHFPQLQSCFRLTQRVQTI